MSGARLSRAQIRIKAKVKFEERREEIPEAMQARVRKVFFEMVNAEDVMADLQLKPEAKVDYWINRMFSGARKIVKKGVDQL